MNQDGSWPYYEKDEIQSVVDVLQSGKVNYWTGTKGKEFEEAFSVFVGCKYSVAVANGTLALELALRTLDVGVGDEVITTPRTFMASASSVLMCGATPVFADIDPNSQAITVDSIKAVLTSKTKAVICVHLGGYPANMDEIMLFAEENNLFIIEDCAQAHGAVYKGKTVGSFGHMSAFSFCQDKIISTGGEGGMVTTNDEVLWKKAWAFKDHGKDYDSVFHKKHPEGFRWLHESLGTNWRLTEMQSAIGLKQLEKLPRWLEIRQRFAEMFDNALSQLKGIRIISVPDYIIPAYYKYYFFIISDELKPGWSKEKIMSLLNEQGVPCQSGGCSEVYLEKCFEGSHHAQNRLPIAKELGETSMAILLAPTLTREKINLYIDAISSVFQKATK